MSVHAELEAYARLRGLEIYFGAARDPCVVKVAGTNVALPPPTTHVATLTIGPHEYSRSFAHDDTAKMREELAIIARDDLITPLPVAQRSLFQLK